MNIEAEQQVLGCLLTNNACIASIDFLRSEHFSEPAHQRTYDEACRRIQAGEEVTAVTLYRQMGEQVPEPGRYFAHLAAMAATVPSVASIAWEVVNRHHATKLVQACNEAVRLLDTESPQEVSALLDSAIRDVLADHSGRLTATDAAVTEEILEDLKTDLPAMKTGIQKLDDAMDGGMYSGKLYGVMARKKVGKTVLASTISYNLAQDGVKHLFICGEMGPKEIQQRNLARELQVFPSAFRNSYGRSEDFMIRIAQYITRSKRCIIYQNAPGLTFDKLRQYCVSAVYKHKVKGIILDYWQLVGGKASRASTAEHLDEVAQWLANFGRQHNVWMFVTAQENQDGNTRGGEGLRLACDQCYCLHRENLNEPGAWMEMIDTRYTRWTSIGEKDFPALYMHDKGPYFSQEEV